MSKSFLTKYKRQKGNIFLGIIIVVVIIVGMAISFTLLRPKGSTLPITPSQLIPSVSASQARKTICGFKKDTLFSEVCDPKFDSVGKDDKEKLAALFTLLDKIKNDKSLSDYDRLLLGQAVFAVLPTKDSPLSSLYHPSFWAWLKGFSLTANAYAQEQTKSEEEFRKLIMADLQQVVDIPKGDNAWAINVMISKYQWINGERQPIYSDQYSITYVPYPGVSTEQPDESKILYHVQARVGQRSTSQTNFQTNEQNSTMIAYTFTMNSWYNPPYGEGSVLIKAESGPPPLDIKSKHDFSETGYSGENLLSSLLTQVKMPQPKQESAGTNYPAGQNQSETVPANDSSNPADYNQNQKTQDYNKEQEIQSKCSVECIAKQMGSGTYTDDALLSCINNCRKDHGLEPLPTQSVQNSSSDNQSNSSSNDNANPQLIHTESR